ncbi:UPF0047 protein YjbQ [hydrothermal vent metagenome]|uniref:UPF0047 protein YjbQ n=1 Tax=hydrothermal vent metagenome TaxID=652676 RepID=A0A3B0T9W5_9ZZZZ
MVQKQKLFHLQTRGAGLYEFTDRVNSLVNEAQLNCGLLTLFCRHTSCSLLIGENADPDVLRDLKQFFDRLVPEGMDWVSHVLEGDDDMPAHIKCALSQTSVSIPVMAGRAVFGVWQGIYLFEHRRREQTREVVAHLSGEQEYGYI